MSEYEHEGYPVCSIKMSVDGNTKQLKYFRENLGVFINNAAGYPLVKKKSDDYAHCKSTHNLFVIIKLSKEFAFTKHKGFVNQYGDTAGRSKDVHHYIYHYDLRLIKMTDNKTIYSRSSDEVRSYTDFRKSREWSAKRIAYDLKKAGMLSPEIY